MHYYHQSQTLCIGYKDNYNNKMTQSEVSKAESL